MQKRQKLRVAIISRLGKGGSELTQPFRTLLLFGQMGLAQIQNLDLNTYAHTRHSTKNNSLNNN